MRVCTKKKHVSHAKSWISMLNSAGIRQKTASVPAYNNLYHYAGNNPVRYIDPDGREEDDNIFKVTGEGFSFLFPAVFSTSADSFSRDDYLKFSDHMNKYPETWLGFISVGSLAAAAGVIFYDLYKKNTVITSAVNWGVDTYNYLERNGVDFKNLKYTYSYYDLEKFSIKLNKVQFFTKLDTDIVFQKVVQKNNDARGNFFALKIQSNLCSPIEDSKFKFTVSFSFNSYYREKTYEEFTHYSIF